MLFVIKFENLISPALLLMNTEFYSNCRTEAIFEIQCIDTCVSDLLSSSRTQCAAERPRWAATQPYQRREVGSDNSTALVAQLQAQRIPFRALAHSAPSHTRLVDQQVESVFVPDHQGAPLLAAFADVDRLFLLTPSSTDQALVERRFVDVAREVGVKQIVKLSVFGAEDRSVSIFQPHRESEHSIRQTGIGYSFLRPNLFMQNLGTTDATLIKQQNTIFNSAADGVVSFIDTHDIAAVAVAVLQNEQHLGQTYDLTGKEAISYDDVAQKLTTLLGRRIAYVALDDAAYHHVSHMGASIT